MYTVYPAQHNDLFERVSDIYHSELDQNKRKEIENNWCKYLLNESYIHIMKFPSLYHTHNVVFSSKEKFLLFSLKYS